MTLIKLKLAEQCQDTASRQSGVVLRNNILNHINAGHQLEIDCANSNLTPSFTDEAFGLLCHNMSHKTFLENIKFINLSLTHKSLLMHVLGNRFNKLPSDE
ncbi:MAG: STAS-like domain-containing protein [Proteobacteria bacterium]|nr:STAS-like domain-containing protein [Pseudomonadota bacterium]